VVVLVFGVLRGAGAVAGETATTAVGATLDMPVLSAYAWRGQILNDASVVQPGMTMTKGGFSFNTWGNYNLMDNLGPACETEFSEVDLTAAYAFSMGPVNGGLGYIEYLFPHSTLMTDGMGTAYPGTREIYASASLASLLNPTLTVYRDIDEINGFYASLGVSQEMALPVADGMAAGVSASVGFGDSNYNTGYFGVDDVALNDANIGGYLKIPACGGLTVVPAVQYTMLIDGHIEEGAKAIYFDENQCVGSVKLSYVF
jgi:hypothetical protein